MENVKNLEKHDKGNTLFIILKSLNELGYKVSYKILNAKDFGVPQNRERIILVGHYGEKLFDFEKINAIFKDVKLKDYLDEENECFDFLDENEYTLIEKKYIKKQKSGLVFCGYRNKKLRTIGAKEGTEHLSRVHKQPNRIYSSDGVNPTLSSQETNGRYFIYHNNKVRKLTIKECYRIMGFPENFKLVGSISNLYERIGNSVCVPMVKEIANEVYNQFWKGNYDMDVNEFLEEIYIESLKLKNLDEIKVSDDMKNNLKIIVEYEETLKGVYTVLLTSLVYKSLNPNQDVRYHQVSLENGYSGRTFDTKYITPFLKQKNF